MKTMEDKRSQKKEIEERSILCAMNAFEALCIIHV
jgi:hypothetical protein